MLSDELVLNDLVVLQTGINTYAPPKTDEQLLEQTVRFQDMIQRYAIRLQGPMQCVIIIIIKVPVIKVWDYTIERPIGKV